jgi:hypothetical protein
VESTRFFAGFADSVQQDRSFRVIIPVVKTTSSFILALACLFALTGCSASAPEVDKAYLKTAAETGKDVRAMFDRAGGDYQKLSPEERERYVKSFGGDEKAAQEFWGKMKSGNVSSGGPARP